MKSQKIKNTLLTSLTLVSIAAAAQTASAASNNDELRPESKAYIGSVEIAASEILPDGCGFSCGVSCGVTSL